MNNLDQYLDELIADSKSKILPEPMKERIKKDLASRLQQRLSLEFQLAMTEEQRVKLDELAESGADWAQIEQLLTTVANYQEKMAQVLADFRAIYLEE